MSDSTKTGVDNIKSDSAHSDDTEPTMSTSQALQALPVELISMLSELLNDKDLLALRSTSRELRTGSAFEFCHRFLESIEISGSSDSIRQLILIVTSPTLPQAPHTTKRLLVSTRCLRLPCEECDEPDATDVACLLQALPRLTSTKFVDDRGVASTLCRTNAAAAPVFLACMTDPCKHAPSHLSRLDLFAVRLDGYLLSDVLEAHKHGLRTLSLNLVTLISSSAWLRALEALLSTGIDGLDLAWFQYEKFESLEIGQVPFPDQMLKDFVQKPVRTDAGSIESGSIVVSGCSVEATCDWVKPVLEIVLWFLTGKRRSG